MFLDQCSQFEFHYLIFTLLNITFNFNYVLFTVYLSFDCHRATNGSCHSRGDIWSVRSDAQGLSYNWNNG